MIDLGALGMTEIIRLQNKLEQELTRRFQRHMRSRSATSWATWPASTVSATRRGCN
jgi:hypothetical protein